MQQIKKAPVTWRGARGFKYSRIGRGRDRRRPPTFTLRPPCGPSKRGEHSAGPAPGSALTLLAASEFE